MINRNVISEAVHLAVTDVAGDSGVGHCDLYALAGVILLQRLTGKPYQIQAGSLMYHADPSGGGWFEINAENNGVERLEYHAWIGLAGETIEPGRCQIAELIDFSTRHLKTMTETMQYISGATKLGDHWLICVDPDIDIVQWTRTDGPPEYLWTDGEIPDEFRYSPGIAATVKIYEILKDTKGLITQITQRVITRYRELERSN